MDGDDDMIMIIVGDDEYDVSQTTAASTDAVSPLIRIKEEQVDVNDISVLDLESILETAELHGEYINLIKDEYYNCEYLDDNVVRAENRKLLASNPKRRIKKELADTGVVSPQSDSDDNDNPESHGLQPPRQSYVDQLLKNFPKMRKDEEYLVAHLTEMMKQTKPPIPPIDFCSNYDDKLLCAYCDMVSLTLPIACRHYQKKHGKRYLACYACGATFKCTTGLYKHEKRCPAPNARLVLKARGQYLGRKGRRRPYLTLNKFDPWNTKKHSQTRKRYYCSECTASFGHKDALTSHEYMHRGIRPYHCDQCPVAYTSAIALKRHLVTHTDVQHICDVCGRSFKAKTTLIVHMNTHLPQRKYPCDRCERRFAQKSALQHHINRDHLNIPPPLVCTACPKRFPRISNLKAHMKAKHGLTLMTRKMFFKALPSMKETELKHATIVFNHLENDVVTAPLGESIFNKKGDPKRFEDDEDEGGEDEDGEDIGEEEALDDDDRKVELVVEIFPDNELILSNEVVQQHATSEETLGDKGQEEKKMVPKNAAIKTSISERCELEFVSKKGKNDTDKTSKNMVHKAQNDLSETKIHENITKVTGRGKNMPVLLSGLSEGDKNDCKKFNEKTVDTIINANENTKDVKDESVIQTDCGDVCKIDKTEAGVVKTENTSTVQKDINRGSGINSVKITRVVRKTETRAEVRKMIPMQTRSAIRKTRGDWIKSQRQLKGKPNFK